MTTETSNLSHAMEQAAAQFASIREMVTDLQAAIDRDDMDAREDAEQCILEDALAVLVRSDWHEPGASDEEPGEYHILLCTGGPAVRMIGTLNKYGEPETARIECQDWFTPWAEWHDKFEPCEHFDTAEDVMLEYARCFYFGD